MSDPTQPTGDLGDKSAAATGELDPRRWLALGVIAVAQLMIILDASIVNIALPSAQADLGISDADRQWVVTAYTLAFGGLLLLGGRIADFMGRKRTFIVGLLGFAGASALGGVASNAALLFAARGLQGAFAALLAPAALSLITVMFTLPKERARAFGVFGAISGGGAAIGLIVGGALTEYASWRWCLGVNVPIALGAALAAVPIVHESKAPGNTRYDVPGALLATLGLVSLVYGFTEAAKLKDPGKSTDVVGWTAGSTLFFLIVAVVLLVAFVVWELRADNPLLPTAHHPGPQPWRLRPCLPPRRSRAVRDVPVPHLLLPDHLGIQPVEVRFRVPPVQRRHHRRGRSRGPATAADRSETVDGRRHGAVRCRDAPAHPDHPGHRLLVARAATAAAHERWPRRRVHSRRRAPRSSVLVTTMRVWPAPC